MASTSDTRMYTLKFSGALDDDFLASFCPAGTTLTVNKDSVTLANLRTDQSGIIGVIRHLHNLGCVVLEMTSNPNQDLGLFQG